MLFCYITRYKKVIWVTRYFVMYTPNTGYRLINHLYAEVQPHRDSGMTVNW